MAGLFWTLSQGGTLVLPPSGTEGDPAALAELIARHQVTHLLALPSLYQALLERARPAALASLRAVIVAGEACPAGLAARHHAVLPQAALVNEYGPTEATVWSTAYRVPPQVAGTTVPIGRPIANTEAYVLDRHLQPVPVGVAGELYLGGEGLARGYWQRPGLTAARFVPHPFATRPGARLYRTGDVVRWRADGTLEWLGRSDHQLKWRGYRIEPEEIEAVLQQHPAVRRAAVALERSRDRLVAWVVPAGAVEEAALRAFLQQRLPAYLVPAAFVFVDALPLTAHGKVDRHALPSLPATSSAAAGTPLVAPRDALEYRLLQIWEQVLGVRPLGVWHNFFDLGGHSLLAMRLLAEIEKACGHALPLSALLQAPTVAQLAALLRQEGWQSPWRSLVALQPGGRHPPFFCVPGAAGDVLYLRALAELLGPEQPFYGLQAQGLDGKTPFQTRIEEMAAHYLTEVRQLQPTGPYFLGGHSSGGLVAFEMACRLRQQGEAVALLALFDTFAPGYVAQARQAQAARRGSRYAWLRARWQYHVQQMAGRTGREQLAYVRARVAGVAGSVIKRIWQAAVRGMKRRLCRFCLAHGRPIPARLRHFYAYEMGSRAAEVYRPGMYPGKVTVFCSTPAAEPQLGWAAYAAGGVEVVPIPGDHRTLFRPPHVCEVARQLQARLAAARGHGSQALLAGTSG